MKKFFLTAAISTLLFTGCNVLDQNTDKETPVEKQELSIRFAVKEGSKFQEIARSVMSTVISSADDTLAQTPLTITENSVYGTISGLPVGQNNTVRVTVYDSTSLLIYSGEAITDITGGRPDTVAITLTPVSGEVIIIGEIIETIPTVNLDSGLVAYFPFDNSIEDYSVNELKATVSDGKLEYMDGANAFSKSAASFDGLTRITVDGDSVLNIEDNISITGWIKSDDPKTQGIIDRGPGLASHPGYYVRTRNGHLNFATSSPYTIHHSGSSNITDGEWKFFAVSYNNNKAALYINGALDKTVQTGPGFLDKWNNNAPMYIGSEGSIWEFFTGGIDELRIYNRTLNYEEIQTLYTL